jgi:hypothetical protein
MPQPLKTIEFVSDGSPFLQDGFGIFRIIPKSIFGDNAFNLGQSFFSVINVKDNSANVPILL